MPAFTLLLICNSIRITSRRFSFAKVKLKACPEWWYIESPNVVVRLIKKVMTRILELRWWMEGDTKTVEGLLCVPLGIVQSYVELISRGNVLSDREPTCFMLLKAKGLLIESLIKLQVWHQKKKNVIQKNPAGTFSADFRLQCDCKFNFLTRKFLLNVQIISNFIHWIHSPATRDDDVKKQ